MNIGDRLREMRQDMFMTQVDLAIKSGVSRPTIIALESGKAEDARVSTLVALAKALETTVDKFFYPDCSND